MKQMVLRVLVAWALGAAPTYRAAAASIPDPSGIQEIIRQALDGPLRQQNVLVHPRILQEMVASAGIFTGNFCFPPDSPDAIKICDATVNAPAVTAKVVGHFVAELVGRRPQVTSLGARYAEAVQADYSRIGWPTTTQNAAAVVKVGPELRGSRISLVSAMGPSALGVAGDAILMVPGASTLRIERPGKPSIDVALVLEPRSETLLVPGAAPPDTASAGSVEIQSSDFCYLGGRPVRLEGAAAVFNWGRVTFRETADVRLSNLTPFALQTGIDIRVADETGNCGADCRVGLATTFVRAIGAWRGGCERCTPNTLSVVRVERSVWVDERIADRLRRSRDKPGLSLDLAKHDPDDHVRLSLPSALIPTAVLGSYEEISSNPSLRASLCGVPGDAAPWVHGAQGFLCPGMPGSATGLSPMLRVRAGATSCGPPEQFMACGLPNGNIELTTSGYRYRIATAHGEVSLRAGPSPSPTIEVDAFPVVFHEVGHWFGVPHPDQVNLDGTADIMASTLGDGPVCLSAQALLMLNNAADLRWPFRIAAGGGLSPPRSSRPRIMR